MDVCELCSSEYKNLGSHVRQKHNMSMDEYAAVNEQSLDLTDEIKTIEATNAPQEGSLESAGIIVTRAERESGILDVEKRFTEDMQIGELLKLKGISLQELGSIISQYITGSSPHPVQDVSRNEEVGLKGAKELLGQKEVSVTNLHIAEALHKKFGYEVTDVTKNPKTWHLRSSS